MIIDINMRNIYKLIHMSFLHIWHFFQHCPTQHNTISICLFCIYGIFSSIALHIIRPHHILQRSISDLWKLQFLFFPFLLFIIYLVKLSSMLISYFVLVHNVYIAHENVELVPALSSVLYYLLHFLENRA